jgi:uncharacterized protein (TIGR00290 family)
MNSIVSWSGGKDSCLALWRAQKTMAVSGLLTALDETGLKARSHGVTRELLCAQAQALGLQNHFIVASWTDYEQLFINKLLQIAQAGHSHVVFGDIDLLAHREWEEKVCAQAGLVAQLPLWDENRQSLVEEFLDLGFKARVVCVDGRFLDASFVGCEFDRDFLARLPPSVDACGENGEFHTFVYDGPNFTHPVAWKSLGKQTYVSPLEFGQLTYYFDLLGSSVPILYDGLICCEVRKPKIYTF